MAFAALRRRLALAICPDLATVPDDGPTQAAAYPIDNVAGSIGARLKAFRERLGLSQRAFAEELGVSSGYVGDISTGRAQPSRNFLRKVRARYGVSSDWLLFGSPGQGDETPPPFPGKDEV